MRRLPLFPVLVLAWLCAVTAQAAVSVQDDTGRQVTLAAPAQRIVSLAPHTTEMLFAAGAGTKLVGAVEYSDYPEAAKHVPRVGGYERLDMEAIVALRPDLVLAWQSGNPVSLVAKLRKLGIAVFVSEPREFQDIPSNIERIGRLTGTDSDATKAAQRFRLRHAELESQFSGRTPVKVFYQIWYQPLMTINGEHLISKVVSLCGGENVFTDLPALVPQIDLEAVLAADPEVIVASGMTEARPQWMDDWRKWPQLRAVQKNNLFFVPPDLIQRHTPRILQGAKILCDELETARRKSEENTEITDKKEITEEEK